LLRVIVATLIV